MTGYNGPVKNLTVMGENWELVKSATDGSISFPFDRVNVTNYSCERLSNQSHALLFTGYLKPTPNTLEQPQRLVFIGFPTYPIAWANSGPDQLRKMHVYKADMKNFGNEFTSAFLSKGSEYSEQVEIKPFPEMEETRGGDNGRANADDED